MGGTSIRGENTSLFMYDYLAVSTGGKQDYSVLLGRDSWHYCSLPGFCTCQWPTSCSANGLCCSFLSKCPSFFLPCFCLAKPNPPQAWHLSQINTLPVSFPSIAFTPIKPHKSTIIIKNIYFSHLHLGRLILLDSLGFTHASTGRLGILLQAGLSRGTLAGAALPHMFLILALGPTGQFSDARSIFFCLSRDFSIYSNLLK